MGPHVLQQLVHNHEGDHTGQGDQDVSHPLLGEAGPLRGGAGVQRQPGLGEGKPWTCRSIVRGWSQSESAANAAVHVLVREAIREKKQIDYGFLP